MPDTGVEAAFSDLHVAAIEPLGDSLAGVRVQGDESGRRPGPRHQQLT